MKKLILLPVFILPLMVKGQGVHTINKGNILESYCLIAKSSSLYLEINSGAEKKKGKKIMRKRAVKKILKDKSGKYSTEEKLVIGLYYLNATGGCCRNR